MNTPTLAIDTDAEFAASDLPEAAPRDAAASERDSGQRQYLTFQLIDEEYGVDILQVQEIRNYSRITPIPNTPVHIKGVMNLRGTVVPIMDLRQKFNLPFAEYDHYTVIIVVNIQTKVIGLVVDAVNDVLNCGDEDRDPPPGLGGEIDSSFIEGLAKQDERLITLLNIEQLVGSDTPISAQNLSPE